MKKTEALNIIKHLLSEIEEKSNEVIDLSYRLDAGTVNHAHPLKSWITRNFYDGTRTITITVEYRDGELTERSRHEVLEFFHDKNPEG